MHQPLKTPRKSLYYQYKVHPFVRPPEMNGHRKCHDVVVVGAGLIGLTTALDLARYGISCVILESELQVCLGSRALAYTRRSMEILQQIGVADRVTENGLPWRHGNSYYRGQPVYRMEMPYSEDDRFPPLTNLQQQILEGYLVDLIDSEPLIELRWGSKLTGIVRNGNESVVSTIDTPEGEYELESEYLVATDGARSQVRKELGLRMEGSSYEGNFVIADIRVDLGLPTERRCYFDPVWNPGNTVLMHREPYGIWRIDFQLPAGESPEEALEPESLESRINAQLEMIGHGGKSWELDWSSVYSARTLTLPEYVHKRVIFCGDAAHMLPIFGVRGANTGWQDCQNMAWKLALTLRGHAGSGLLHSYTYERVPAAWEIIDEASKSTRFMTPPSYGFRLMRDAALSLSMTREFPRPLLNWRTSRPHEYNISPLNVLDDDSELYSTGPSRGAPIANVRLGVGDFLMDHLGPSFYLFLFTRDDQVPAELVAVAHRQREQGVPFHIVLMQSESVGSDAGGADLIIDDSAGRVRNKYGVMGGVGAYLVRPDQHVCARWFSLDSERLARAMDTALGKTNEERA